MSNTELRRDVQIELDKMKSAIHRAVAVYEANTNGAAPVNTVSVHVFNNAVGGREIKIRCDIKLNDR